LYVDKSQFIKDILCSQRTVQVYAKARRMGKTINLTMLRRYIVVPTDFPQF